MNQFIAIFAEPIIDSIDTDSPLIKDRYSLSDNVLLLQSTLDKPQHISELLGISEDEQTPNVGVVFKLEGSYNGYQHGSLWNWLEKARASVNV